MDGEFSNRLTLSNHNKGNKELMIKIEEFGYPKKKYAVIFAGNSGQQSLPMLGYSDNQLLVQFAEKLIIQKQNQNKERLQTAIKQGA
jgi:hypothetical protein